MCFDWLTTEGLDVVCFVRCVSIFPDQQGFAVGSIEGRVGIEYFNEQMAKQTGFKPTGYGQQKQGFAFKCHRANVRNPVIDIESFLCIVVLYPNPSR